MHMYQMPSLVYLIVMPPLARYKQLTLNLDAEGYFYASKLGKMNVSSKNVTHIFFAKQLFSYHQKNSAKILQRVERIGQVIVTNLVTSALTSGIDPDPSPSLP